MGGESNRARLITSAKLGSPAMAPVNVSSIQSGGACVNPKHRMARPVSSATAEKIPIMTDKALKLGLVACSLFPKSNLRPAFLDGQNKSYRPKFKNVIERPFLAR